MRILIFLALFIPCLASAQVNWNPVFGKQRFVQGLGLPASDTANFRTSVDTSAIVLQRSDSALYYRYKGNWKSLNKFDSSSLSNRINLKLNISDTAFMLSNYLRKNDTASLSNRINTKLNISDTASMLTKYLRKDDTASLSNRINTRVPYTGANSNVNLGNYNISANSFFNGFTSMIAAGTTITLTIDSTPVHLVTGSGGQTYKLPNATTLQKGTIFSFNNNQSSGSIDVNNNSNTLVKSAPSGAYMTLELLDNTNAAGSWDAHFQTPSNSSWSTNTLDWAGSYTNGTWNGNVIAYNRGGTGQSANFTQGGIIYGNTTTAMASSAAGTTGQVLISNGTSAPSWINQIDTTSLSSRINTKLNSVDTASLSTRINTKLNAVDTASLSNRINNVITSGAQTFAGQKLFTTTVQDAYGLEGENTNTTNGVGVYGSAYSGAGVQATSVNGYALFGQSNNGIGVYANSISGTYHAQFGTAMYVKANGNTLLGTTTDNAVDKLQVNGTMSATNFTSQATATYSGTVTFTGTAPTGLTNSTYRWSRAGNCVTLNVFQTYSTAGNSNTAVTMALPSGIPTPAAITGTGALEGLYFGTGYTQNTGAINVNGGVRVIAIRNNAANNGLEIYQNSAVAVSLKYINFTIQYFTN